MYCIYSSWKCLLQIYHRMQFLLRCYTCVVWPWAYDSKSESDSNSWWQTKSWTVLRCRRHIFSFSHNLVNDVYRASMVHLIEFQFVTFKVKTSFGHFNYVNTSAKDIKLWFVVFATFGLQALYFCESCIWVLHFKHIHCYFQKNFAGLGEVFLDAQHSIQVSELHTVVYHWTYALFKVWFLLSTLKWWCLEISDGKDLQCVSNLQGCDCRICENIAIVLCGQKFNAKNKYVKARKQIRLLLMGRNIQYYESPTKSNCKSCLPFDFARFV